jgi:hypothetical protein
MPSLIDDAIRQALKKDVETERKQENLCRGSLKSGAPAEIRTPHT